MTKTASVVTDNDVTCWYYGCELHRDDGPAIVLHRDGTCMWYKYGKLHREDGPAVIDANGTQEWWINGKLVDPLVYFVNQTSLHT